MVVAAAAAAESKSDKEVENWSEWRSNGRGVYAGELKIVEWWV